MSEFTRTSYQPATEIIAEATTDLPDDEMEKGRSVTASALIRNTEGGNSALTLEATITVKDSQGEFKEYQSEYTMNFDPEMLEALAEAFALAVKQAKAQGLFAAAGRTFAEV